MVDAVGFKDGKPLPPKGHMDNPKFRIMQNINGFYYIEERGFFGWSKIKCLDFHCEHWEVMTFSKIEDARYEIEKILKHIKVQEEFEHRKKKGPKFIEYYHPL